MKKLDPVDQEEIDTAIRAIQSVIYNAEEIEFEDMAHVAVPLDDYNALHDGFLELKRILREQGILK